MILRLYRTLNVYIIMRGKKIPSWEYICASPKFIRISSVICINISWKIKDSGAHCFSEYFFGFFVWIIFHLQCKWEWGFKMRWNSYSIQWECCMKCGIVPFGELNIFTLHLHSIGLSSLSSDGSVRMLVYGISFQWFNCFFICGGEST